MMEFHFFIFPPKYFLLNSSINNSSSYFKEPELLIGIRSEIVHFLCFKSLTLSDHNDTYILLRFYSTVDM